MKIFCAAALIAASAWLVGCQAAPPAIYANYIDNRLALRKFSGSKVRVSSMSDPIEFVNRCRLVGPIKTEGNRPLAEFVRDSLNDEFKYANIYSDDPGTVELTATLKAAEFSSMNSLIRGYWSLSLQLANSANGKSLTATSRYDFDTGFDSSYACANTSNALTAAVQRLIFKSVSYRAFAGLIGH